MGISLQTDRGRTLYSFWGDRITKSINKSLKNLDSSVLINLASDEYFKSINRKKVKADILNIKFKEERNGQLKFLSFNAKVARGLMARYIIKNQINAPADIKGFDYEGYYYSEEHSTEDTWLFIR